MILMRQKCMEQMEQMEHTQIQIVIYINSWNRMEQNGTNSPVLTINDTTGTGKERFGTLKALIFILFRVFHLFHGECVCYGERINLI